GEKRMKCSSPECNRAIGLVSYQRGWFGKRRYCSQRCRDVYLADASRPVFKRFVMALISFVGIIVPATFTMAVLAAPPPRPDGPYLPGCEHTLATTSASVAAVQARLTTLSGVDTSEICTATRLYFLELVKARAVAALCKSGIPRQRDLERLDADV